MILAQCGSCENQLKFSDESIGKQIKCPNCGNMVELPAIAVAKPITKKSAKKDDRPREITTESLIDIEIPSEEENPKKNSGDNEYYAKHKDEIEGTNGDDEYTIDTPIAPDHQTTQPYQNGLTPINQPIADPYSSTPMNAAPGHGNPYAVPHGVAPPPGALPTFDQYQANKPIQAHPVQAQPVQAQPVQAQPVQAQPVQAQPVQAQPVQAQPVQAQPVQAQPVQAQPVQAQPVKAQPVQAQPVQAQPVKAQPVKAQSVKAQPVKAQPVKAQPVKAQPVPNKPVETAPLDIDRNDAEEKSKPSIGEHGAAQKRSVGEQAERQNCKASADQEEASSTSANTKRPLLPNEPSQSQATTTTQNDSDCDNVEEDSLTLLRDSTESKLHDSGLLDGDQADDGLPLEKRPADDPATATPNTKASRSQASEKTEKNFTKKAAEQKPNEPLSTANLIQPQKEKITEHKLATEIPVSTTKATPIPKNDIAAQPVQAQPVQAQPVQAQPVQAQPVQAQPVQAQPVQAQPVQAQPVKAQPVKAQPVKATATPVQTDAANAIPAIAKAVPIATVLPQAIPVQEAPTTTPVSNQQPTSSQPTNAQKPQLENKPKFGEKKPVQLSQGAKKAVLYGGIGTALVVVVLLALVLIQKVIASGPAKTFEAYKIAVKNNDFSALYDVVDSATRDTFDNYAEAKSKETPVDYSLRGKDKFVAVATKRFESTDAIKQKTIDSKLQLIEKATIVSESVNRNRASVQVRFEENATESITFEKVDGDWKIGVPTFSLLFVEY